MSFARLATLWGLGRLRPAPGTIGSAVTIPFAWLLHWAGGFPLFALGAVAVTGLGWLATERYLAGPRPDARPVGGGSDPQHPEGAPSDDPSEVIIDEVAGQMVALAPLSLGLWLAGAAPHVFPWPGWIGAFLLFRAFDIFKPPPIGYLERLPGATGVMADDLGAGLAAAILVTLAAAISHGWLM